MIKIIRNINFKLVLLESVALFFLVSGFQRLYVVTQAEKFEFYIYPNKFKAGDIITTSTLSELTVMKGWWTIGFLLIGIIFIGFINWKIKESKINSILVALLLLALLFLGFFTGNIIYLYMNYFGGFWEQDYMISYLISGGTYTTIGALLLLYVINRF